MDLNVFFNPKSIAVIGASREPGKVGYTMLRNLIEGGFPGELYPINPNAEEILGLKCYRNIRDVPANVDVAVITVPARIVPSVIEDCGLKGVKGIIVITAGFGETGVEGMKLERDIAGKCRKYGMRMQGPNCLGIISVQAKVNATFAPLMPPKGNIAFISQSGAIGSAILNWAVRNEIGFTKFISLGNEADLTAADFIEALGRDPETKVIALYIEGVKNGERFIEAARRVARHKPIIAIKAGTTDAGVRAVSSHTGSLAGSDVAVSAAFKKAGIIRVETLEDLFNFVLAFGSQPIPKGKRVLIVTNGGGPGILATDACEKLGLELPLLEPELLEYLRRQMPPHSSLNNPVDVLGDADENRYRIALEAGVKSSNIDGVILILTPQAMTPCEKVAAAVVEVQKKMEKTLLASFMGLEESSPAIKMLKRNMIPNYAFPEIAARVFRAMYDYSLILNMLIDEAATPIEMDEAAIRKIIDGAIAEGRRVLTIDECIRIAEATGISMPKAAVARSKDEAGILADSIGYPVVMKIISPDILHKTDIGGVVLGIRSRGEAEEKYETLIRRAHIAMPRAKIKGVLVQSMAPAGKEVIVGSVRDRQFGPLLMFGLGGIYVNFLKDVAYRLAPLSKREAAEMIEETKAYILLRGVRGEPPSDIPALIDVILKISQLMVKFRSIAELEINPLFVYESGEGCLGIDIRATISIEK
ncbi:MAG: acetate--CoA ligase family protein [Nitrososphaerota archaeon]|nr:acetate--CoA ligase family protein [Candidatus Bathyarchaeota archaeon]MDW8193908.1 acetate--CoA ligase family protein [Nitrososphaerota archaeon]